MLYWIFLHLSSISVFHSAYYTVDATSIYSSQEEQEYVYSKEVTFEIENIGTVIGIEKKTADIKRKMYAFYGLPFGKDTSGSNRFKHSIMETYDNEVYNLTIPDATQVCPQGNGQGTEDCLKLYIYTTKKQDDSDFGKLPVMVWIYGGAFVIGDFQPYQGDLLLAEEDIVLVVPHYRLGVLGFMSLGTEEAPGNAALSDQILALEWVQKYISSFGGDPNHVVLAGESAGAASVSHLMLYDGAKDLFHGVISESGSPLDPWALDLTPVDTALEYGNVYFDCSPSTDTEEGLNEFVECMREVPAEYLVGNWTSMQMAMRGRGLSGFSGITPVVQKEGVADRRIISELPFNKMSRKGFNAVPILYGSNYNEGSFVIILMSRGYLEPHNVTYDETFWKNEAWSLFMGIANLNDPTGCVWDSLKAKYFDGIDFTNFDESVYGLIDMMGALFFKSGAHRTAELVHQAGADAYLYSFEFDLLENVADIMEAITNNKPSSLQIPLGVSHGMEMPYIWPMTPLVKDMKELSSKMVKVWANFVKHLKPTPVLQKRSLRNLGIPRLPPFSLNEQPYLRIDKNFEIKNDITQTWTGMVDKLRAESDSGSTPADTTETSIKPTLQQEYDQLMEQKETYKKAVIGVSVVAGVLLIALIALGMFICTR